MIDAAEISRTVSAALAEDVGSGDITAALIPAKTFAKADICSRERAVICGIEWVNEVYRQVDQRVDIEWLVSDGMNIVANQKLCHLQGPAQSLLTGERTALNFLQLLSGTATTTKEWVNALAGATTKLLDTRKTIPGLRTAQKYAVVCGGGTNHRMGLFDAFLIKENHIAACGSITEAVRLARALHSDKLLEVEVESIEQLKEALELNIDVVMLDNFNAAMIMQAVTLTNKRVKLEVSGNVNLSSIQEIALLGVDYISVGAITKHVRAIDLSMRFS